MLRSAGVLAALLFAMSACAGAPLTAAAGAVEEGGSAQVVYLDFAGGTTGLTRGEQDDATHDVSQLCAASFARWEAPRACAGGDRDPCREEVVHLVRGYYSAYDVELTLTRPSPSTAYTTVIIAPPHTECSFGRRGVAFADCGDANRANIAMVFDCHADAASCAVLVAHEVAHSFGLVHSVDPLDIMTLAPDDPTLRFQRSPSMTIENDCGVIHQSSHERLLQVLGPAKSATD